MPKQEMFSDMKTALRCLVDEHGVELLSSRSDELDKLLRVSVQPHLTRERTLIKTAVDSKIGVILLRIKEPDELEKQNIITLCHAFLSNEVGFPERNVQKVIDYFIYALHWDEKKEIVDDKDETEFKKEVPDKTENLEAVTMQNIQEHKVLEQTHVDEMLELKANSTEDMWVCVCGKKNGGDGLFCISCGKERYYQYREEVPEVQIKKPEIPKDKDLKTNILEKNKGTNWIGLVFICCICIGIVYTIYSGKTNSNSNSGQASVQNKNEVVLPKISARTVTSDLSLANIVIGDNLDMVNKILGQEDTRENKANGYIYYEFKDVQVVMKNGKVEALVSKTDQAETKRKMHEGSNWEDVLKSYGSDYIVSDYNDLHLYEYSYVTEDKKKALLRFAVKKDSNKVFYISVRVQEAASVENSINIQSDLVRNGTKAQEILLEYHASITRHNLQAAYNYYASSYKDQISYKGWAPGYANTISSDIIQSKISYASDNLVKIDYTLKSRDRDGNRVKSQIFKGTATLITENGKWLISEMVANLERAYYE